MLGRSSSKHSRCNVDGPCAHFLQHEPGLDKIAAAVACQTFYRDAVSPQDLWSQVSFLNADAS